MPKTRRPGTSPAPVSLPTTLLVSKGLRLQGFGNFTSATVRDKRQLAGALALLSGVVEHPVFRTRIGGVFALAQIEAAMQAQGEAKSLLLPS